MKLDPRQWTFEETWVVRFVSFVTADVALVALGIWKLVELVW